jgi:hypothetical protein
MLGMVRLGVVLATVVVGGGLATVGGAVPGERRSDRGRHHEDNDRRPSRSDADRPDLCSLLGWDS